jgi:hypothetical protein
VLSFTVDLSSSSRFLNVAFRVTILLYLLCLMIWCLAIILLFLRSQHDLSQVDRHYLWYSFNPNIRREKRIQFLYLGIREKNRLEEYENEALSSVARLLQEFFYGFCLAPSDIFIGMLLLRRRQNTNTERARLAPSKSSRAVAYNDIKGICADLTYERARVLL